MDIDYEVRRLPSGDRYEITLRFKGEASGRSTLTIPTQWASATHAERGIEGLEVLTAGARLEDSDEPRTRHVVHRPNARLIVRYRLKQIADGEPSVTDDAAKFLPVDRADHLVEAGFQESPDSAVETIRYRALGRPLTRQHVSVRADLEEAARRHCMAALGVHQDR